MSVAVSSVHFPALAASYDTAPLFDAQVHSIPPEHLLGVGKILVEHGMHKRFRAFLVHRHEDVGDSMGMVHTYPDTSTDICQMEPLEDCRDKSSHSPASFRFSRGRPMEPFDYVRGVFPMPSADNCWKEIGLFLHRHGLDHIIGISRALGQTGYWVEYLHQSGSGTTARMMSREHETGWLGTGVATEWAFHVDNGTLCYRVTRKCDPPREGGGHVRS